jgi:HK97 family phage major capsid protein
MPKANATVEELITEQGEAFAEFQKTVSTELTELKKRGRADTLTVEKLTKLEKSMDDAIEAKNRLESGLLAERKEREDLEKRLNRPGATATSEQALLVADFKSQLNRRRADLRKPAVDDVDQKMFDDYKAAQLHYLRTGKDDLSPDEIKTLQISVDPDGGYLVTPDTSGRMVKKIFETSPIRQIASVANTSKDKVEGIEDTDEAGAGYAGERAPSGNTDTPQVGKWEIPIANIDTEPKATANMLDDADFDIEAWLGGKVGDKFGRFESAEHCTGVGGANKIRGFTTYDVALDSGSGVAWGSLGYIKTGVNGDFAAEDPADKLFDLIGLLKNGYLLNARFVTRREVITKMRKFKDDNDNYMWQPSLVLGNPESFAGYPITRAEDMPALSSNGNSLAFGDFREGYQIFDRQGIRVLRDPFTAKPYIKFYTTKRSGGGVLNYEAIKILQFAA